MAITNDINTDVSNKTIPNGSNNVVGIAICHQVSLYFDHGFRGKAWGFFRDTKFNVTNFTTTEMHDLV